jgi:pimeloyl-ACP methyl ester carboxylesterase
VAAVLFLHGLGTGPGAWSPQREALGDRPTAAPPLPLDIDAALEAARAELERLPAPADVCGLSLGAVTALRLAAEEATRVRRLVLAAGFARLPRRLAALQVSLGAAASLVPTRRLVRGLAGAVPEPHRADAEAALAHVRPREVSRALRSAAAIDLRDAVARIASPALVLCGERDRLNLGLSRDLADRLASARFAVVPGAGHVANLDNSDAFNRLLLGFLDAP